MFEVTVSICVLNIALQSLSVVDKLQWNFIVVLFLCTIHDVEECTKLNRNILETSMLKNDAWRSGWEGVCIYQWPHNYMPSA